MFGHQSKFRCAISAFVVVTIAAGCGESNSMKGVLVTGMVTLDGSPLAGADVSFLGDTHAGYGRTDETGMYRLVQGAIPGKNKIVISKIEGDASMIDEDPESGMDMGQMQAASGVPGARSVKGFKPPTQILPPEYSNPQKTRLSYEVPADVDFHL